MFEELPEEEEAASAEQLRGLRTLDRWESGLENGETLGLGK